MESGGACAQLQEWEPDREDRPRAFTGASLDSASMSLHRLLDDVQPQA